MHSKIGVAAFVDGANVHASLKGLDWTIDFEKLKHWCSEEGVRPRMVYYTAVSERYPAVQGLLDHLSYHGWQIRSKPAKEMKDAEGRVKIKGNMDIEIAVDAMNLSRYIDTAYLFSGDGDFADLVKDLQAKGVYVIVVSTEDLMADSMRRQADQYFFWPDLKSQVQRSAPSKKAA